MILAGTLAALATLLLALLVRSLGRRWASLGPGGRGRQETARVVGPQKLASDPLYT